VEGIVEMMLDATKNYTSALTKERLFGWHSALFSSGWINLYKITVSDWRNDSKGSMQVVSGAIGKEKNRFQDPNAALTESEISKFLQWLETDNEISARLLNINVQKSKHGQWRWFRMALWYGFLSQLPQRI